MDLGFPSARRLAALGAVVAIVVAACGSSTTPTAAPDQSGAATAGAPAATTATGEKVKLVWSTWGNPDELSRFDEFDKQFMAKHPDIEVTLQAVPDYGDYHSKLLAQLVSGTAPDVFYIGDDNIGKFVDAKVLTPLDDRMNAADSVAKPADFFDGLFGAARAQDGTTYGIPTDDNPDVLWYDKKALEAAGITEDPATLAANGQWTTAKFLEMMDKLKAAGLAGAIFWNYWATHWSWVSANGGTVYDDQGNFVLPGDQASVAALDQLGKLFQDGRFVVADTMPDGAGAGQMFLTDKAGFFVQGRYTIGELKEAGVQDNYDVVTWPTVDGTPKPTGVAAAYMAINGKTPSADAAWRFLSEFVSAEGQAFRLSGGGNAVPSVKGADAVVLEGYPVHAQSILDARDIGFAAPAAEARVPGLSGDISAAMLDLYTGKATTADTITRIEGLIAASGQ